MNSSSSTSRPAPTIVAHRGASRDAPENTLAAFRLAWEQGADAIEGDFHLARDGRIVCTHDFDTDSDKGDSLPVLPEVLATVPAGKGIYIEVKCGAEIVPALLRDIDGSGLEESRITVIAFDARVISAIKQQRPALRCLWLSELRRHWTFRLDSRPEEIVERLQTTGADGVGCRAHKGLNAAYVKQIRQAGFEFHVWTVDDPAFARRLLGMGVQSITTNVPGRMREDLAR